MFTVKTPASTTPKRYQNPELFERLAMEYAIGMLHGRARQRFAVLMKRHLYLQATVDAYEHKFACLADVLSEKKPHSRVWKKIKKQTNLNQVARQGLPWWQSLRMKTVGFVASLFLVSGLTFLLLPSTPVEAYVSVLKSDTQVPMAMITVKKGEGIYIQLMDGIPIPNNMKLTLWCLPKEGSKAMMMGALTKLKHSTIKIDHHGWQDLAHVKAFAISLEPTTENDIKQPSGDILYKGELQTMLLNAR
jgi:anti-sigma-K factor RskA